MFQCKRCRETHPPENFDEHNRRCKACRKADKRDWYHANREKVREQVKKRGPRKESSQSRWNHLDYHLRTRYGIDRTAYDALLLRQTGRCDICESPFEPGRHEPAVDHCHTSGRVRSLLCIRCNTRLGFYESTGEDFFTAAEAYVLRHQ